MGGTPYSILDGLRNACQPTRHRCPARTHECRRSHVGIGQGAYDFISSTLDLEPPFPPCRPTRSAYGFSPDAVYLLPSLHPDCPSCPKSLTRSWRRSLLLGETTGLLPETPISTMRLCAVLDHALEGSPGPLMSSPRPLNAAGSLSMDAQRAHNSCPSYCFSSQVAIRQQ